MTRATWKLAAAALVATLAACAGGSTAPVAGILKVQLSATPNSGADGAILLTVSGPRVPSGVAAAAGFRLFGTATASTSTFAVIGTLSSGSVIMTLSVDDVTKVGQYSATVRQVAASANFALRTTTNYTLSVTK